MQSWGGLLFDGELDSIFAALLAAVIVPIELHGSPCLVNTPVGPAADKAGDLIAILDSGSLSLVPMTLHLHSR